MSIHPLAKIGERVQLGANVYIGPDVTVGNGCVIKSGAVIGHDGFGYTSDDGRWTLRPHQRGVVLEDGVHVGANACIDSGSWRPTHIGRGSKIDNCCHLAHNVVIFEDVIVVAHAMLAGSVTVGSGAWIGPSAAILQRLTIGERALVGMGAVVIRDVPENVTVAGNPARIIDAEQGVREAM